MMSKNRTLTRQAWIEQAEILLREKFNWDQKSSASYAVSLAKDYYDDAIIFEEDLSPEDAIEIDREYWED